MEYVQNVHTADPNVYCRNLVKDPMVTFISRTFLLWAFERLGLAYDVYRISPALRARSASGWKDIAPRTDFMLLSDT